MQSLGKFFEELIHNNQDTSGGGSKGRRTTIAAQRASELLHELSVSMEKALITTKHDTTCADRSTRTASSVRRSTAVDTDASRTLWDKLSDEVAQHEFTFDPLSPPAQTEGSLGIVDDKQREVKRAERGLQRMHKENGIVYKSCLSIIMHLLFSFDQDMTVKITLIQILACQLSSTLM